MTFIDVHPDTYYTHVFSYAASGRIGIYCRCRSTNMPSHCYHGDMAASNSVGWLKVHELSMKEVQQWKGGGCGERRPLCHCMNLLPLQLFICICVSYSAQSDFGAIGGAIAPMLAWLNSVRPSIQAALGSHDRLTDSYHRHEPSEHCSFSSSVIYEKSRCRVGYVWSHEALI